MKRHIIAAAVVAVAAPLFAQQADDPVVAVVNGETITLSTLDQHWNRIGEPMRQQYKTSGGGKFGFLENYVTKRLLLQEAIANGFDKRPEVQAELEAAKESALFDLYVRDVLAAPVVTDQDIRRFYDENIGEFTGIEQAKVRVISINRTNRTGDEARSMIAEIMAEVYDARDRLAGASGTATELTEVFAQIARARSEHDSAMQGGDLGWVTADGLDPRLTQAIFSMKPGTISGIIDTLRGPFLVYVEDRKEAAVEPFESARAGIREYLLGMKQQEVVNEVSKATQLLRSTSKVTIYKDHVE